MTVNDTTFKITGNGDGAATVFSFDPIVIFEPKAGDNHDLEVTFKDAAGLETPLTEGTGPTNYSVDVASYPGTGNVIYPADQVTPMASGESITVKRVLPLTQLTALRNQGGWFPKDIENQLDRLVMIDLQQQEELDRVLKASVTDTVVDLTLPSAEARANRFLGFDFEGKPIAGEAVAVPVTPYIATLVNKVSRDDLFLNGFPVSSYFYGTVDLANAAAFRAYIGAPAAPTLVDNQVLRANGVAGEYQGSGLLLDDSARASGSGTLIVTDATTARTLGAADLGKTICFTSGSAITVTLPEAATEDLIDGFHCQIVQAGAGAITFAVEGSDELKHPFGATATPGDGAMVYVFKRTDTEWYLAGGVI